MSEFGFTERFEPDPDFRLDAGVRARVLPWFDASALEYFLSGMPAEVRTILVEEFFTSPGGVDKSMLQFSGPGVEDPALRAALIAVFAPLHAIRPELAQLYPFDQRSSSQR